MFAKISSSGVPDYLRKHYWFFYLWPTSVKFFDLKPVINAILFGHYSKLVNKTLELVNTDPNARVLQLTCVYGDLTSELISKVRGEFHICDVAETQINLTQDKIADNFAIHPETYKTYNMVRMNAEKLSYADNSFDQVIIFFLLHEMPAESRKNVYAEVARIVKPGGSVLITEYAENPKHHFLHKQWLFRWITGKLEPFLHGFWKEPLITRISEAFVLNNKPLTGRADEHFEFDKFYRVIRYNVSPSRYTPL